MIGIAIFGLILAGVIYFATYKLSIKIRILASVVVFTLVVGVPIGVFVIVGDKAPEGSRVVKQEELKRAAESAP